MRVTRPRRAWMRLAVGIGAAVLLVAGSSAPAAGDVGVRALLAASGTPTKTTPAGLLTSLDELDSGLTQLMSDWKAGKIGGWDRTGERHAKFVARVKALGREKLAIVGTYFDGPTYGRVTWSEMFSTLDCLDSRLSLAEPYDLMTIPNRKLIPGFIEAGQKCKQKLETDLRRPGGSGTATPAALLTSLDELDGGLTQLISDWKAGKIGYDVHAPERHAKFVARVEDLQHKKLAIVERYFDGPTYGSITGSQVFAALDGLDRNLYLAWGYDPMSSTYGEKAVRLAFRDAQRFERHLLFELMAVPPPEQVTISEDDTWVHNPEIRKSNICINVRTTPPQASVSGTLTGPGGYSAHLDKRPLDEPGSIQITAPITQAGEYTKTLVVYDATGTQTATVTKMFTVAAPPQDGPATTPACPKPTE